MHIYIHSFLQGWSPLFSIFWGNLPNLPPPHTLSRYPPLSEANFKNYPFFLRAIQIGAYTLKWRSYILYYTKLIENVIIITIYTFRINSVFTADSLVKVRYCL